MKKKLTDHQRHLLLVESAWGHLEAEFLEALDNAILFNKRLPTHISIPVTESEGSVRLHLTISQLEETD